MVVVVVIVAWVLVALPVGVVLGSMFAAAGRDPWSEERT